MSVYYFKTFKRTIVWAFVVVGVLYLTWRFIRPMNVFIVEDKIAWPINTSDAPVLFKNLSAKTCGNCHKEMYKEWKTTIHSQAWTDPYFQVDMKFDRDQFVCRLCHTPLDRQLPSKIIAYSDKNKWNPILKPNPDFDPKLQHEGVTCAVCHLRKGKIIGVIGNTKAPHPVKKIKNPNQICIRCHLVKSESFGVFAKFPPCGTVAEINANKVSQTGEAVVNNVKSLNCIKCHMPLIKRSLVAGGEIRNVRRHLWRGGHDPAMVKSALTVSFDRKTGTDDSYLFVLKLLNSGAAHYVPTGTPDRHLSVTVQAMDKTGKIISEQIRMLRRNMLWRPFIIDLSDTRLKPGKIRIYKFKVLKKDKPEMIKVVIRYHLLDEKRRKRINYQNKTPISYVIYVKELSI